MENIQTSSSDKPFRTHAEIMVAASTAVDLKKTRGPEGLLQDYTLFQLSHPRHVGWNNSREAREWASAGYMISMVPNGNLTIPSSHFQLRLWEVVECPTLRWPDNNRATWQKVLDNSRK